MEVFARLHALNGDTVCDQMPQQRGYIFKNELHELFQRVILVERIEFGSN